MGLHTSGSYWALPLPQNVHSHPCHAVSIIGAVGLVAAVAGLWMVLRAWFKQERT